MQYRISFEINPNPKDVAILERGIAAGALGKAGHNSSDRFAFFIRGDNNEVLGGCHGEIWCGCLHIHQLWVEEGIRGAGYGAKLMLSAENLGTEKGCTFAAANTMARDVVSFYQELGYEIEFERKGYLNGSVLYFMRRNLPVKHTVPT